MSVKHYNIVAHHIGTCTEGAEIKQTLILLSVNANVQLETTEVNMTKFWEMDPNNTCVFGAFKYISIFANLMF